MSDKEIGRLRRKLEQRDRRIAGLERKLSLVQHALGMNAMLYQRLPFDVEKAVQRALCNVRMIPVIGVGGSDKIVTVQAETKGGAV